jgi:hypothetical protein
MWDPQHLRALVALLFVRLITFSSDHKGKLVQKFPEFLHILKDIERFELGFFFQNEIICCTRVGKAFITVGHEMRGSALQTT